MIERRASCPCGSLTVVARGEPARVSVCHCGACKRRTGSVFSYNATYAEDQVQASGPSKSFRRIGEEGFWGEFQFCPECGSTVLYRIERRPGMVTIPAGAFADPDFPEPLFSVYGELRHKWCVLETGEPVTEG
jgi:hypothetical protein